MSVRLTILLVAADPRSRAVVARSLAPAGHRAVETGTLAEAEAALARGGIDVVVADLVGVARDVSSFLHVVEDLVPDLPTLLFTDPGDRQAIVEAIRLGAHGVLDRAADAEVLQSAVVRAADHARLRSEVSRLTRELLGPRDRVALLGRSEALRDMSRQVDVLAPRASPVLVVGARGTGKTTVARELHARSPRASRPFVTVACDHVAPLLLESMLFGHRRADFPGAVVDHEGAFRAARGGTLFVDHVELLPVPLQARLVQALAEGKAAPVGGGAARESDARLVCSANYELAELVRSGTFRDDLQVRLAAQTLRLPALAARPEDVIFLAEAFSAEIGGRLGVAPRRLDAEAHHALAACSWPGNVRQLHLAMEHAFHHAVGEVITLADLPASVRALARSGIRRDPDRQPTLAEAEAELVGLVLEECAGNKTRAATMLGIDRKRLYRKIRRYRLLGDATGADDGDSDDDDDA